METLYQRVKKQFEAGHYTTKDVRNYVLTNEQIKMIGSQGWNTNFQYLSEDDYELITGEKFVRE